MLKMSNEKKKRKKKSNDYINCVPIQSRVILTEPFLESQKCSLLTILLLYIMKVFQIRYFKLLRRGNYFQNEIKFSLSIHYFSLSYAFFLRLSYNF